MLGSQKDRGVKRAGGGQKTHTAKRSNFRVKDKQEQQQEQQEQQGE